MLNQIFNFLFAGFLMGVYLTGVTFGVLAVYGIIGLIINKYDTWFINRKQDKMTNVELIEHRLKGYGVEYDEEQDPQVARFKIGYNSERGDYKYNIEVTEDNIQVIFSTLSANEAVDLVMDYLIW